MGMNLNVSVLTKESALDTVSKNSKTNTSALYEMLSFDEEIHKLKIESACNYYKHLLFCSLDESKIEVLEESLKDTIKVYVDDLIENVRNFFAKLFGNNSKLKSKVNNVRNMNQMAINNIDKIKTDEFTINQVDFIDINSVKFGAGTFDILFDEYKKAFEDIITMDISGNGIPDDIVEAVKTLITSCNGLIIRELSLKIDQDQEDYIKVSSDGIRVAYPKVSFVEKVYNREQLKQRLQVTNSIIPAVEEAIKSTQKLEVNAERMMKGFINDLYREDKKASKHASAINRVTNYFIKGITELAKLNYHYLNTILNSEYVIARAASNNDIKNEVALIHGEEFTGNTLFDNEDIRDFNRTDWMDIALQSEVDFNKSCREAYREAYMKECIMYMDESTSMKKLNSIIEAMDARVKEAFDRNFFQGIIEMVKEWFRKISEKINLDKPYLNKYKDIIINKPNPSAFNQIQTTGWIFRGPGNIKHFNDAIKSVNFDYPNKKEIYMDKNKLFADLLTTNLFNKENMPTYDPSNSYIDWLKEYFGAPCGKTINVNDPDVSDMSKLFDFVFDVKVLKNDIDRNLDDIKRKANSKDAMAPAAQAQNAPQPTEQSSGTTSTTNTQNTATPQKEYAYSLVYDTYFTEATLPSQTTDPNAEAVNDKQKAMDDKQTKKDFLTCKKNFVSVMNDIIRAELTAIEFIRKEYMEIIRFKVKHYDPSSAQVKSEINQQQKAAQSQQK